MQWEQCKAWVSDGFAVPKSKELIPVNDVRVRPQNTENL